MALYLIAILLVIGVVVVVGSPLVSRGPMPAPIPKSPLDDLLAEKEAIYQALKELELDLHAGKLTPEDYSLARQRFEVRAVELLQEIDRLRREEGHGSA